MNKEATEIFEIRVREYRGIELCESGEEPVNTGDVVVIERKGEIECGDVITEPFPLSDLEETEGEILKMLRKATPDDIQQWEENRQLEKDAFIAARGKVKDRELQMKLVRVESTLDRKKIRFYFTAENRIDFRELVKDLAYLFKTRIEMRQIGVRDEARMVGGYSHCGKEFCCVTHLRNFSPVTIRMAKDQNLALNPTKISGSCGRLMCCLAYEYQTYKQARKLYPKVGTKLRYDDKDAVVIAKNIMKESVTIEVEENPIELSLEEFQEAKSGEKKHVEKKDSESENNG